MGPKSTAIQQTPIIKLTTQPQQGLIKTYLIIFFLTLILSILITINLNCS
uniref:NADH dehydrogenase subunit 5 C-terminal domain-containing protein n=1 Tax=Kangiella spongicola TaxID=796379 RepID=A0A318D8B0_9GAMM